MFIVETRERKYKQALHYRSHIQNVTIKQLIREHWWLWKSTWKTIDFLYFFSRKEEEMKHKEKGDLCRINGSWVCGPPQSWRFDSPPSIQTLFIPQSTFKPPFIPRSPVFLSPASVISPASLQTGSLVVPCPFLKKTLIIRGHDGWLRCHRAAHGDSISSLLSWSPSYIILKSLKIRD